MPNKRKAPSNAGRAQQNARGKGIPAAPPQQGSGIPVGPGAWAGPFTADACQIHDETLGTCDGFDGAAVFDGNNQPFALVATDHAIGGFAGAKARATLIAETLNRDHDTAPVPNITEGWAVHRPSERDRTDGQPEFTVVLTGECWHDVERNLADAREKLGFTAPDAPRTLELPNGYTVSDKGILYMAEGRTLDLTTLVPMAPAEGQAQVTIRTDPEPLPGGVGALLQSLKVMAEACEDDHPGWSVIARGARAFVERVSKDVTRFLGYPGLALCHPSVDMDLHVASVSLTGEGQFVLETMLADGSRRSVSLAEVSPAGTVSDFVRIAVARMSRAVVDDMVAQIVEKGGLQELPEVPGDVSLEPSYPGQEPLTVRGFDLDDPRNPNPGQPGVNHLQAHPEYVMEPGGVGTKAVEAMERDLCPTCALPLSVCTCVPMDTL